LKIGVAGIGLIGGSFCKAYTKEGHTVFAYDIDEAMLEFAVLSGAVNGALNEENIKECELILICLYPEAASQYLRKMAPFIDKETIVIDCCGTKRKIMESCTAIAEQYGLTYIGGHPMAGTQFSGFKYSKADLYVDAPMVIVPPTFDNIELLDRIKELLSPAGFGCITVTTAEEHDRMIAFTSQMAHVISNAYIKSPTAGTHKGFSAGSYKDLTRVAWLNPQMWAELFLDNGDFLIKEIDLLINNLAQYKEAIENNDKETLIKILDEGRRRKEEVDG